MSKISEIGSFYAGKTVFLTGGTGFLGKALIEKLLYSCEDISKIYVLVRIKKGKTPEERIQHMIDVPEFSRLKSRLNCLSKLIPISGDLSKPDLGISKESIKCLEDEVSVVFHLAATVNFSETLKETMDVNCTGTIQLIKLCHRMKNLQCMFVRVESCN